MEHRGRPKELKQEVREVYNQVFYEYPTKPELGYKQVWYFDINKSKFGPYKVETSYPKGFNPPKIKAEKGKAYAKQPVVMVFKTSNRSNAKVKMKVWANENIDYIMSAPKLPGVPDTAEVLELGVGENFIAKWQLKYNL